jgi:hypothetical protein
MSWDKIPCLPITLAMPLLLAASLLVRVAELLLGRRGVVRIHLSLGWGSTPPPPHLPGHEFLLPAGVTAGVNLGIRSTNATTSRQQSLIAAKGVGDRVVFLVGNRTRNPDQVDVLHLMNQQPADGSGSGNGPL